MWKCEYNSLNWLFGIIKFEFFNILLGIFFSENNLFMLILYRNYVMDFCSIIVFVVVVLGFVSWLGFFFFMFLVYKSYKLSLERW